VAVRREALDGYARILAFDKSAEKYPHINPGGEFEGYTS
jgi:hypothetical protein